MEYVAIAFVAVAVAVGAYLAAQSKQCAFVVRIRDGFPSVSRGKVSQAFVVELAGVSKERGIRNGSVYGVRMGKLIRLEFSRSIPNDAHQALRNVWAMHGR
jgi:hypothetical protein